MDNTQAIPDSTPRDDSVAEGGRTEDQLLADIVRSSNFTSNEESLPTEQVPELDPENLRNPKVMKLKKKSNLKRQRLKEKMPLKKPLPKDQKFLLKMI